MLHQTPEQKSYEASLRPKLGARRLLRNHEHTSYLLLLLLMRLMTLFFPQKPALSSARYSPDHLPVEDSSQWLSSSPVTVPATLQSLSFSASVPNSKTDFRDPTWSNPIHRAMCTNVATKKVLLWLAVNGGSF